MKMKNEEEKNRLSVELCYNHQFHRSGSSILDHLRYEKIFQKYSFNRKISNKVYRWLTLKGSKKHQKIFHSDYDLGSKNHSCENGN